jgi:hypothetical protein
MLIATLPIRYSPITYLPNAISSRVTPNSPSASENTIVDSAEVSFATFIPTGLFPYTTHLSNRTRTSMSLGTEATAAIEALQSI